MHYCRWSWCLLGFSKPKDLTHHLLFDHMNTAPEMRRKELNIIERAEEGIGETMSIPIPNDPGSPMIEPPHDVIAKGDSSQSLPTPPGSEAASPVSNIQQIPPELPQVTGVAPTLLSAPGQTPVPLFPVNDGESRMRTPSFRDLSSPGGSPFMAENPGTPDFDAMVDDAIHSRKRPRLELDAATLGARNRSLESTTSDGSQFAVEQHLTQSLEEEDWHNGELQLSDLIHQEKLDDLANAYNAVTDQSVPCDQMFSQTPMSIKMPIIHRQGSQPFSTQGSGIYRREIFLSHVPGSSAIPEPAPTFEAIVSRSTPKKFEPSHETEDSTTSNSSNLSMPPPAQPPRPSPAPQSQSRGSGESQTSVHPSPDPFFFSSAGTSARQPFYAPSRVPVTEMQAAMAVQPSPARSPPPKHRRKVKSRNPRGISGSFDLMASQSRPKHSSPVNTTRNRSYQPTSSDLFRASLNGDHNSQTRRDEWEYQTQGETLPPIMTQAPYDSQDF